MRLIDADALIKKLESNSWNIDEWELPFDHVTAGLKANAMDRETVEGMPTVDAVPVKHGKWIQVGHIEHMQIVYRCSACNGQTIVDGKFCPNCGARMDEE